MLVGTGNGTFAWSGPNGFSSTVQNPNVGAAGIYNLVVTGANGCTSDASTEVTQDTEVPGATAQGGVLNCNVSSIMLVGTGNGTYAWSGPNGFSSTVQNPNVWVRVVSTTWLLPERTVAQATLPLKLPWMNKPTGTLQRRRVELQLGEQHHARGNRQRNLRMERSERFFSARSRTRTWVPLVSLQLWLLRNERLHKQRFH
ncbi:MAG: hypothetical protein IPO87_07715 [Flavobacteriales bacterium]|nr:hypothetical protein [Flavobacteriales bacterium]